MALSPRHHNNDIHLANKCPSSRYSEFSLVIKNCLFISCIVQTKFTALEEGLNIYFFSFFFFIFLAQQVLYQRQLFGSFFAVQVSWVSALTQESFLPRESFNGNGFANDKSLRPYHGHDVTDKKSDNSVSLKLKNRNFA